MIKAINAPISGPAILKVLLYPWLIWCPKSSVFFSIFLPICSPFFPMTSAVSSICSIIDFLSLISFFGSSEDFIGVLHLVQYSAFSGSLAPHFMQYSHVILPKFRWYEIDWSYLRYSKISQQKVYFIHLHIHQPNEIWTRVYW